MNIFLVGNGFDLHHKFPTSYYDFLKTLQFLIKNYDASCSTVGTVFGNTELHNENESIKECYEKHSQIYDSTPLPNDIIISMVEQAKNNMWFSYLCTCVSKDLHWIDFEKEILEVLNSFAAFFNHGDALSLSSSQNCVFFDFSSFPSDKEDRYILSYFDFFFEEMAESRIGRSHLMRIKPTYAIEKVAGSGTYYLAIEEIMSTLYASLRELSSILQLYLRCFVDAPAKEYAALQVKPRWPDFPTPNYVYSFNYTNTFEILYSNNMVEHIHGNTNSEIVLGINPDEDDKEGSADTTFLQFKKYFQRVFFKTDTTFLRKMIFAKKTPRSNDTHLTVIGHSLDHTDQDIIKQVFESVKTITIMYHSDSSVKNQIRNLVEIYGKEGLDYLREEKELQFVQQPEIIWQFPT